MQPCGARPIYQSPMRLSLVFFALLSMATAQATLAALPKDTTHHRIIIRFGQHSELSEAELLRKKTHELAHKPGVSGVKALEHVGMAIAACDSLESAERLVQELEADPNVELAAPDSWQRFDGAPAAPAREWPMQDLRQCSAQSGCAALGLVGQCCPAADGLMLACCDGQVTQNQVAFKTFFGKYVVAEEDGALNANRVARDTWETFQLFHNEDGTISLRSFFGKYVSADSTGALNANQHLIGDWEKFSLIKNDDDTVSLLSHHNKYVVADLNGKLNANRDTISDWEKFRMEIVGTSTQRFPNDSNFTALWGMNDIEDTDIDAPEAWKTFTGEFSAGIIVAVIDTGIDYTHEDLRDNMWINPGEIPDNGIDDDGNGFVDDVHGADFANQDGDPFDDQLHGTHCAGTIAGVGNNGIGVSGVAWRGVKLMALKFLSATGGGRTSDAVQALDYAVAHGARISSNSWGGGGSSAALRVAIERAEAAGVLFVAAAGNSGTDNDEDPHYPSTYNVDNILAVASTEQQGMLSGFSCYGATTVDVAAPGSRIFSTAPKNSYRTLSGTSMATPHVSGLAALIWMYRPNLSMPQVKELILKTVEHSEALEGKIVTAGRINARKALEAASQLEPPHPPVHAPEAVTFEDVDPRIGIIAGSIIITAAADESDVEYYKVYFVSHAGYQLDAVGSVNATGERYLTVNMSLPRSMPKFAKGLVAVAGNSTGEMPAQIGGRSPNVTVVDLVEPLSSARAASWGGDIDPRQGIVAGKLEITRAEDEVTISKYNVYWGSRAETASGPGPVTRGPLVGSIPAVGFESPKCRDSGCELINISHIEGGLRFNRDAYGNNEVATISLSGPANLSISRFDTEYHYDTLTVGDHELSGELAVPFIQQLPKGHVEIIWYSDGSVTAGGWTFDLTFSGSVAELDVPPTPQLGQGMEIVAAYGSRERLPGIFVEVPDVTGSITPPSGVGPRTQEQEQGQAQGQEQGKGPMLAQASVSTMQAGNPGSPKPVANPQAVATGKGKAVPPEQPWLEQPQLEAKQIVWTAGAGAGPRRMASSGEQEGEDEHAHEGEYIRCGVTLADVDASALAGRSARQAFVDALQAELPHVGHSGVHVTRIVATKAPAEQPRSKAATVEFTAKAQSGAPPGSMDRIEARLMLLGLGGGSAQRFSASLSTRLAAVGLRLASGAGVQMRPPQQLQLQSRAGRGRSLSELESVLDDASHDPASSWREEDLSACVAAAAALAAAAASMLAVAVIRQRRQTSAAAAAAAGACACAGAAPSSPSNPSNPSMLECIQVTTEQGPVVRPL